MLNKRVALKTALLALSITMLAPAIQAKSTLWKVSSRKGTIYIQGSVHVLKTENYPLAPAIEQAYSNSTALILEVDMGEMMSPKTQQLIMGKAMLSPPDTLDTVLSPLAYENLKTAAGEAGLPIDTIKQFKPWFATTMLTLVKMNKMGFDEKYGLDKYFYQKAVADQKKVVGLESIDYQISLFDSLSAENPDDFVNRTLSDLKLMKEDLADLLAAWETGDMPKMNELLTKGFKDYPGQYSRFITARNKLWAKQLTKIISKEETYMVIVGAGHLPGKEGVINLLKKQGFTAEQL